MLEFHEIANVFPLIEGAEFDALVADIKANGLLQPIVLFESKILDGRNRYRACQAAGVPYAAEVYSGTDPVGYVVSLNLKRRHLDESQRAMVAAKIATLKVGRPDENASIEAITQDEAAKLLNIGRSGVQRARKLLDSDTAEPELIEAVERGEIAVSTAVEIAEQPPEVQKEIITAVKTGDKQAKKKVTEIKKRKKAAVKLRKEAAEIIPLTFPDMDSRYRLINSDLAIADIAPGSIDCIITDPPYPEEFIDLYGALAERATEWLKPGGSLLAMAGQTFLPRVLAALDSAGLSYQWTVAYLTPGGQSVQIFPRRVNTFWKPVFWFVKGTYKGEWIGDVAKSDVNDNDKRFHEWGQSASGMADLVKRFTKAGDTICDPFLGGGTAIHSPRYIFRLRFL